ncbi:unnamed protein product [Caenorhabditis brenneri]
MPTNSAPPSKNSRLESNEDQEKEDIREEIRQVEYNIALLEDEMKKAEDREKVDVRKHRKELTSIQKHIKKYEKLTKRSQDRCGLLKNKQRKFWETCWKKWTPQQKESAKQIQKERKKAQEYRKKISNLHEQIRRLQEAKEGFIKPWRLCKVVDILSVTRVASKCQHQLVLNARLTEY